MDKLSQYRSILKNLLTQYAGKPSHGEIEPEIIIDAEQF
ncbi:MAG: XisI protein [Thiomargarita sp.]|nr:XisI protein [Thiomargarita sp.]